MQKKARNSHAKNTKNSNKRFEGVIDRGDFYPLMKSAESKNGSKNLIYT